MTLPETLEKDYAFAACLKDTPGRQVLLLREQASGREVLLKASRHPGELGREYALCLALAGPGIPVCLRLFAEGAWQYLLREYIPGQTLAERIAASGALPPREAVRLGRDLCAILRRFHAHHPPIIHRDVKAENLILSPEGQLFLIDLGIARTYEDGASRDTQVLGTAAVAPPEQFGYQQTDPRSDVYAAGVLLRFLLTGETKPGTAIRSPGLARIIRRCTAFSPAERYADADALDGALARWQQGRKAWRVTLWAGVPALAACAAICIGLASSPAARPVPLPGASAAQNQGAHVFHSPVIAQAVAAQLGKPPSQITSDDLLGISSLLLVGNAVADSWEDLCFYDSDFICDLPGSQEQAALSDLRDLAAMPHLRELALCRQQIADLTPLAALTRLQRLNLHDNQISDVSPLAGCAALQELRISGNPVTDLSPLAACPRLYRLNASKTPLATADSLAAIPGLQAAYLLDCPALTDASALARCGQLQGLSLWPCSAAHLQTIGGLKNLRYLALWEPEGMTDLRPLAALGQLEFLFLDSRQLAALDGVDALACLTSLSLFHAPLATLAPLRDAPRLNSLELREMTVADLSALASLPPLSRITCDQAMLPDLQALGLSAELQAQ